MHFKLDFASELINFSLAKLHQRQKLPAERNETTEKKREMGIRLENHVKSIEMQCMHRFI